MKISNVAKENTELAEKISAWEQKISESAEDQRNVFKKLRGKIGFCLMQPLCLSMIPTELKRPMGF